MNRSILAVTVASLLSYAPYSLAQQADETMVVTANRFEQPKSSVIASADVITKQQIEQLQLKTLTEALKWLPGVQVTNNGGQGQSSDVYIRGNSSSHIIVLLNGVRIGSSTLGSANFTAIPLTGVEKIELVRGARAAIYGADAIGGVINIVTDVDNSGENSAQANVGFGSDGYKQANAGGYTRIGDSGWFKVGVNAEGADGFDATDETYTPSQPDKDGFERYDLSLEIGSKLNDNWQGRLSGFYHDSRSEYDAYIDYDSSFNEYVSPNKQKSKLLNVAGQLEYSSASWFSSITVAQNRDESVQLNGEFPGSTIVTDRFVASWLASYEIDDFFKLLGGLEYLKDSVSDSILYSVWDSEFQSYDDEDRKNLAGYISSIAQFGQLDLEASLRHDDNDAYGEYTTWQLGAAYNVSQSFRLISSAGTAFKTPTYNDLYWPEYGNPELKPEESFGYEAGFEAYSDYVDVRVVGYRSEIDNLISYQGRGVDLESSNAVIKGVEISASFDTGPFSHFVSVDLLDFDNPVNVAGSGQPAQIESKKLNRRAEEVYKWLVSYACNDFQADLAYMYQGERFDDTKNLTKLDSYSLVDISLSYDVTEQLKMQAKVSNLFDEDYETVATYNTQERAYYLNAHYKF
ncbi:TonB-dependent receptor [Vibrio sp. 404]|uniref:Vitamin B12 transporter BtuB n=1 Tax=Vibrio marinisediminis TaxID=2758441 RepID=A0A7W2FUG9_9VIBR|nr:TonB-dependent receptor [Vibrio marinisediminis]MBA5764478.1 TonB-dependent receptor [Vibrio marinisediminis]